MVMNQGWQYEDIVCAVDAGQTILAYYTQRYSHSTPSEWQTRIEAGQVLLNGHPAQSQTLLSVGQRLTYHRPPWQEPTVPLTIEILYEDDDLLVVNKPAGLPILPGGGFLEHTLLRQLQHRYPQAPPVPIHRLGRGTSGLVLLARSPEARAHLSQQMREHQIQKRYRTLVAAGPIPDTFTVTQPIGKIPHPVLGYIYGAIPQGAFAQSSGRVLERRARATLLEVTILTGRPHQIRIHMAAMDYPLLGDPLYEAGGVPRQNSSERNGKLPVPGDGGYLLHAYALSFIHSQTRQLINLCCPPPTLLCGPQD
jgi:23S rRNA pseudouridine1911/1915/1917 synthase